MISHRWERDNDQNRYVCEAPPEPRGPSYGKVEGVCPGDCGAVVTDEQIDRATYLGAKTNTTAMPRMTLDLVWSVRTHDENLVKVGVDPATNAAETETTVWAHCSPGLRAVGNIVCNEIPSRECQCPLKAGHDHLLPSPGTVTARAARPAESPGTVAADGRYVVEASPVRLGPGTDVYATTPARTNGWHSHSVRGLPDVLRHGHGEADQDLTLHKHAYIPGRGTFGVYHPDIPLGAMAQDIANFIWPAVQGPVPHRVILDETGPVPRPLYDAILEAVDPGTTPGGAIVYDQIRGQDLLDAPPVVSNTEPAPPPPAPPITTRAEIERLSRTYVAAIEKVLHEQLPGGIADRVRLRFIEEFNKIGADQDVSQGTGATPAQDKGPAPFGPLPSVTFDRGKMVRSYARSHPDHWHPCTVSGTAPFVVNDGCYVHVGILLRCLEDMNDAYDRTQECSGDPTEDAMLEGRIHAVATIRHLLKAVR